MLVIRLQRTGRSNLATYRLIVAEKARPAKGKFHEIIGHYLPSRKDDSLQVNTERVLHWIGSGAVPSDTVARLLKRQGMKDMDKFIKRYTKQKPKKAPPEGASPVKMEEPPVTSNAEQAAPTDAAEGSQADGDKA